uniref:Uncharacterized protein n=1 Tax=Anguilla anguilla TaxID=7936 RepID=A0A0E9XQK7_ANGAN
MYSNGERVSYQLKFQAKAFGCIHRLVSFNSKILFQISD